MEGAVAMAHDTWQSPLMGRYASKAMQGVFSDNMKFSTWRRIWLELARAQQQLGVTQVTDEALAQMEVHLAMTDEDYEVVRVLEKANRHDVQSHANRFGQLCPAAAPIIHLAATSMEVDDNTYLIVMREALGIIALRVARVLSRLAQFAHTWRDLPTLGYTHFQPAEPVTVGKRGVMWAQDQLMDLQAIEHLLDWLPFRGIQGATGTQNSFLDLFNGDREKVVELNRHVTAAFGFSRPLNITGQTYTRKIDTRVLMVLADLCASMHKMCTDLRLLANKNEIEEPFEPGQV
ncbi:MAG: adenylosuccinate lyase, partial [Parcubacteria group bacterium]|nr:adenylosuccinate lyase [Parcubacteria group bacterium]